MTGAMHSLRGLKILILEDGLLVAMDLCAHFEDCGCKVVGPVGRVAPALSLAREAPLDGALMDVNLAGEFSFPVAAVLSARNVPYVFLTGYDSPGLFPPEYRDAPRLAKPFRYAELDQMMTEHFFRRARVS